MNNVKDTAAVVACALVLLGPAILLVLACRGLLGLP